MKSLNKHQIMAVIAVLSLIITATGYRWVSAGPPQDSEVKVNKSIPVVKKEPAKIYVHVTGAVANSGLYTLPKGSRVNDAVQMAKPTAKAEVNHLNLAEILVDGQKVVIPSKEEVQQVTQNQTTSPSRGETPGAGSKLAGNREVTGLATGGKINLNQATQAQLDTLPHIGPALAQRIVEYRQQKGGFRSVQDLKKVKGIGVKKFEDLKDLVTI
ncbi:MAG: helix-hairpin-helix domain-containing protein [Thermincolia bacterium]